MRIPLAFLSSSGVALTALGGLAFSQTPSPPAPSAPAAMQAAVYDPQQFPTIRGELDRLTLTGRGDIDGFILKDGTEVKTASDLSTQIAYAIKPGDRVTIHGLKAAALPLVRAVSITDEATHRTVSDAGTAPMNPPPRPAPPQRGAPPPPAGVTSETSGRIRMALHGPQGEVNGVLLDNGTILRFPPDQGAQLTTVIQPRQSVVAEGITTTNALGTVVDVQQMGPSRDRLVAVGPPAPPMDDRGPAGPRRRPPPPDQGTLQPPPPVGAAPGAPPFAPQGGPQTPPPPPAGAASAPPPPAPPQ